MEVKPKDMKKQASEKEESSQRFRLLANQWREFAKTQAYKELMEYIDLQKEFNTTLASGPMEVYKEVPTFDGAKDLQLDFEPEKYAYLLQRSVGCDIVKSYVEVYVNNTTTS